MGFHIDVRIDLTPTQKRIMRGAVVTSVVLASLGIGLAVAKPKQWMGGDPLAAADLNGLNVVSVGNVSYSVGATKFCGQTKGTFTGNIGGYSVAKTTCETTCSSPTAHMCTIEEIIRSAQLGVPSQSAAGWYAGGFRSNDGQPQILVDCQAWTSANSALAGPATGGGNWAPTDISCNQQYAINCCD